MAVLDDKVLLQKLKELEVIEVKLLDSIWKESVEMHVPLGDLLMQRDLITDENLGDLVGEIIKKPVVVLSRLTIEKEILDIVPEIVARKQKVIMFKKDKRGLHLGMVDPENLEIVEFIKKKTGLPVSVYYLTNREFERALNLYAVDVAKAFDEIIEENVDKVKSGGVESDDLPIIKIVDTILMYAGKNRASDVHLDPSETALVVRFRIDGVLHDVVNLPLEFKERIITRVKVMSKLRTDEHQAAQDGKMRFGEDDDELDIRVSIVPIIKGEKVVMRLLSEKSRQFSLASLGFGEEDLAKVSAAYEKPFGMILATGPTGSGKTTTMYAILKLLNKRDINIMTIEDPVEYDMQGINQIQVNPKTELTFAKGLRSILRQDPNVILVGEIRDGETAGIAINSAMTGHLVLSTLHTNDAATSIPRLLDMGIEPFLVSSTVNVIIAQRLVRKICMSCRASEEVEAGGLLPGLDRKLVVKFFGKGKKVRVYRGRGCPICHNTGYVDRVGIFETMVINEDIRRAINERRDAGEILKIAVANGMRTMLEDGIGKVMDGLTTTEEVLRVTKEQA